MTNVVVFFIIFKDYELENWYVELEQLLHNNYAIYIIVYVFLFKFIVYENEHCQNGHLEFNLDNRMFRYNHQIFNHFCQSIHYTSTVFNNSFKKKSMFKFIFNSKKLIIVSINIFKGSFYSAIESYGLLYRSLTPISSWITFLLYSETSASLLLKDKQLETENSIPATSSGTSTFAIFLCILYAIFKLNQLYGRYIEFKQSFNELLLSNVSLVDLK